MSAIEKSQAYKFCSCIPCFLSNNIDYNLYEKGFLYHYFQVTVSVWLCLFYIQPEREIDSCISIGFQCDINANSSSQFIIDSYQNFIVRPFLSLILNEIAPDLIRFYDVLRFANQL